jgi:hypothetical protein
MKDFEECILFKEQSFSKILLPFQHLFRLLLDIHVYNNPCSR